MNLKRGLLAAAALAILPGCAAAAPSAAPAAMPAPQPVPVVAPDTAAKRPDFSGVWQLADPERAVLPEFNGEFTPEAKANREHFKKYYQGEDADPAVKVCLSKGMPWSALIRARDYPVEIYQTNDRIIMMFELYDQWRTIRINGAPKPDNYPDSPNGYSVGHWEGDTLVIETTGMAPLNPIGPNLRGSNAKVTERWHLAKDPQFGETLVVDLVQEDPEVFVKPGTGHNEMRRAPADVVVGGYNCSSALWDDHVERMEAEITKQANDSK